MRELGKKGTDLIISYEKEVLHVYDDGFGYPTVGIGHLLTPAEKKAMPLGTKITKEQSRAYFKADAAKYVKAVNNAVKVPVTQNQFDALVSLAFNIGVGAIAKASLIRKLNAKDYAGAADGFLAWNKAKKNGKMVEVKGLTRRRKEERSLFLTPDTKVIEEKPHPISAATPQSPTNSPTEDTKTTDPATTTPPIQVEIKGNDNEINLPDVGKTADTIQQQVPRITTGVRWLGTLGLGGGFATVTSAAAGLPPWAVFLLGVLTAVLFIGLIWLIVKYYGKIFSLVNKVIDNNTNPDTPNVQLVSRKEGE